MSRRHTTLTLQERGKLLLICVDALLNCMGRYEFLKSFYQETVWRTSMGATPLTHEKFDWLERRLLNYAGVKDFKK